jgi:predicted O-methyltransferase YrrM
MNLVTDQFDGRDAATLDRLIKKRARPGMIVFELGTYTGRSAMTMLPHIKLMQGKLYCVDWFRGNPGVTAEITTSYQKHNILEIFLNNIKEAGYEDYVTVLVGTSHDVSCIVAQNSADLIFIDADHRYSKVKSDILQWCPKLKPGGVICGHDFDRHLKDCDYNRVLEKCEEDFVDGCHYGVTRAVCESFPYVQWEGRIWYARKGVVEPFKRMAWHGRKALMKPLRTVARRLPFARKMFSLMNNPRLRKGA